MNEKGNVVSISADTVPTRWELELNGVRQPQRFNSPIEAAKFAAAEWPDVLEVILQDDPADDAPGWLVVPVKPDQL